MNEIENMLSKDAEIPQLESEVEKELSDALNGQSVEQYMDKVSSDQSESMTPDEEAAQAQSAPTDPEKKEGAGGEQQQQEESFKVQLKRGRISSVRNEDVFVDFAGEDSRLQGVVPLKQFDRPPRPGSIMDFVVERIDESEGLIHLSREGAVSTATWEHLTKGASVEARVVGSNKGGLELEMVGRIRAFMPASQVDVGHVDDLDQFIGQKIQATVSEIDRRGKRVIISRRRYLEQEKARASKRIWSTLEEGKVVKGKVTSLVQYGAFVDIGGVDGLLHITDMSYARVRKPDDIVKVGDEIDVQVLKLDHEKKRVRLGLKQTMADPWDAIEGKINVGDQITGTVVRIADFGAFIEIEPQIEGLLPASEISWRRNAKVSDEVSAGQSLRLAVIAADFEKRRITLSLKQSQGDPWVGAEHKFARDSVIEGTVKSTTEFGAFIEVEAGVEGLVHISELANQRVNVVEDVVKVGETHKFRVLEIDEEKRKLSLSIRAVENPVREEGDRQQRGRRSDRGPAKSTLKLPKGLLGPRGPLKGGIE